MIPSIDSPNGLTVFIAGRQVTFAASSFKYDEAVAITNDDSLSTQEQTEALVKLEQESGTVAAIPVEQGFTQDDSGVYYNGRQLSGCLATKVQSMLEAGMTNFTALINFLDRLGQNPSKGAADELYDFLSYKELPITEDGFFLAYKGVRDDWWSSTGNTKTRVLQGKVDNAGRIYNGIGEVIEISRQDVDDDRRHGCSEGAHVGSLDYAKGFCSKLLVVKVDPKDVVSVPTDCNFQKLRTCKYEVVSEYEKELTAPVAIVKEDKVIEQTHRSGIAGRVSDYLDKKGASDDDDYVPVTVRQIQNAMSPEYPQAQVVLRILDDLGWDYDIDSESIGSTTVWV